MRAPVLAHPTPPRGWHRAWAPVILNTDGRTPWALLYSDVQVLLWGCYVRDTLGLWFWTLGDLDKDVNDFSLKRLVWA